MNKPEKTDLFNLTATYIFHVFLFYWCGDFIFPFLLAADTHSLSYSLVGFFFLTLLTTVLRAWSELIISDGFDFLQLFT